MSLVDLLRQGDTVTREQLADELDRTELELGAVRRAHSNTAAELERAHVTLRTIALYLHEGHDGAAATCVRGECVKMRLSIAAVKG